MLSIRSFVNKPVSSNCYVLYDKVMGCDCIIVDPGSRDERGLLSFLTQEELRPQYIILTHEHFDHCWGVNQIVSLYNIPIVCSAICADAIRYEKRNCSVFYDFFERFAITCETLCVESIGEVLPFAGDKIHFFKTPGHTEASICFVVGGFLFTGDTIIKDEKTVTKLPTGSIERLKESIVLINRLKGKGLTVCPGHGELFELDGYDLDIMIKSRFSK